jgi:hypothetical protein
MINQGCQHNRQPFAYVTGRLTKQSDNNETPIRQTKRFISSITDFMSAASQKLPIIFRTE